MRKGLERAEIFSLEPRHLGADLTLAVTLFKVIKPLISSSTNPELAADGKLTDKSKYQAVFVDVGCVVNVYRQILK